MNQLPLGIYYLNLTNGLQAIEDYQLNDYRVIRIPSTWCEQKLWNDILMTVSDDFLYNVARGHSCVVFDYGANKEVPRAIWQGLEWIKYVLFRRWYPSMTYFPEGRASQGLKYFQEQYRLLDTRVKQRLNYFKRYVNGMPNIKAVTGKAKCDGNYEYHVKLSRTYFV